MVGWQIPMNRVLAVVAIASAVFCGAQALADDSIHQPTISKRQMIVQIVGCMKKRMSTNRAISYNEAEKACKDQITKQNDNSISGTLVASDALGKP